MSDLLRAVQFNGVGTTETTIYTAPAGRTSVVVGLNIANISDQIVKFTLRYRSSGGTSTNLCFGFSLPPGSAYVASGAEQKFCINAGDSLRLVSTVATSLDVLISLSEVP